MGNQKEPIKKVTGPCTILAGAGTGKTHIIVEKIKYLLENKIYSPEKMVCLTFSNEATNSLRNRILSIIEDKEPIIRTFHAFCSDLLKEHGDKMGISPNFKILLPDDAKIILNKNLKIQPYQCHQYTNAIGTAKDLGIKIEDFENYLKDNGSDSNLKEKLENLEFKLKTLHLKTPEKHEKIALTKEVEKLTNITKIKKFINAWKAYEKIKKIKNLLDYSDLNKEAVNLLQKYPEISNQYQYIIVDEFQDTNKLQFDFLKLLTPHKNITVVGDLNQSIYRFRGAYKENFNLFKKEFSVNTKDIFNLDKSFRSPNTVLKIAHQLIKNNYKNQEECFLVTNYHNREGNNVNVFELNDSKEETRKIIEIIQQEIENGVPENEICVLFRTHQQSQLLKKSLEAEGIQFTAVGVKSLMRANEIKKTIDFLRLSNATQSKLKGFENSWWNIFQDFNFSKDDLIKIGKFLKINQEGKTISELVMEKPESMGLSKEGNIKVKIIIKKIEQISLIMGKDLTEMVQKTLEIIGLGNIDESEIETEKFLCLQKFLEFVQEFSKSESPRIQDFLYHITIMENLGIEKEAPTTQNSGVRIMTQHATKGLEYKVVIISNLVQKKFPIERISNNSLIPSELSPELKENLKNVHETERDEIIKEYEKQNQLLEERRLCYVAFTRAKEKLYLTFAKEYSGKKFWPSQFLNEINYKKNPDIDYVLDSDKKHKEPQLKIEPASIESKHVKFSQSSLLCFDECQKKYEYRYIYKMPEPQPVSWEAMNLGSFIHQVLDDGVKNNFQSEKEFIILAKSLQAEEKWSNINLEEATPIIKIFFERNKNKYSQKSKTEIMLSTQLSGLTFKGFADRIDFHENGIEIIDYKTGNYSVKPKARNFQLGLYALAAQEKYGKVHKLTLDMLKKEKPLEFILDSNGDALEAGGRMSFNLQEIKEEILETARAILECYKSGFQACGIEKNCEFCNEYVHNL